MSRLFSIGIALSFRASAQAADSFAEPKNVADVIQKNCITIFQFVDRERE